MTQNQISRDIAVCLRAILLVIVFLFIASCDPLRGQTPPAPQPSRQANSGARNVPTRTETTTQTPIKHIVVIFQENISFDHYFGTYPVAANQPNETPFRAKKNTPSVNNLLSGRLLDQNPNSTQPFRMSPAMPVTCDQNHRYTAEQDAFDRGLMDKFPEFTGLSGPSCNDYGKGPGVVMGYFDGNTVTAIWNYAQQYSMNDNSFSTMFGPSTIGALNLVAGTTSLATLLPLTPNGKAANPGGNIAGGRRNPFLKTGAAIGDAMPGFDDCVLTNPKLQSASMITETGKNVGDLLNAKSITWCWFQGGFAPTGTDAQTRAICGSHHAGLPGDDAATVFGDYVPHHEPFEYFSQSANQHHVPPSDATLIGTSRDGANHQYDLSDFWAALKEGRLPTVTYLKAAAYQDAHPGYSDPLDEQTWLVDVINGLEKSSYWKDLAIVLAYDDSDGWYDHVMGPVVNQSAVADDTLWGGNCGSAATNTQGQCGYGPRQPLLVISPYARQNYVDHRVTDQASILRFIEDNWSLGRIGGNSSDDRAGTLDGMFDFKSKTRAPKLTLDRSTGAVVRHN